jgi:hypothetical protein
MDIKFVVYACAHLRHLINVTQGITKAQVVQFWQGIWEKDLQQ